jgi:hypothetical protein
MSKAVQAEARLRELLAQGSLPASHCGRAFLEVLGPLLETGVLIWERTGAGRRLKVWDSSVLAEFVAGKYPGLSSDGDLARIRGIGQFRDSKALANDAPEIAIFRAWDDAIIKKNGEPFGAAQFTNAHGICAIQLRDDRDYSLHGICALVENPALFTHFEKLDQPIAAAFLARGRVSDRLLNWLAHQNFKQGALVHFPDYDPVGLSEFTRIKARLGEAARLHKPADLRERFRRFSNRALLDPPRSCEMLGRLRNSNDPDVIELVALIDEFGAGLEQEALLLNEA